MPHLALLFLSALAAAGGYDPSAASQERSAPQELDADSVRELAESARGDPELDEALRAEVLELCSSALEAFEQAARSDAEAARFQAEVEGAPALSASIREQLAQPPAAAPAAPAGATLQELERLRAEAEATLQAARGALDELAREAAGRGEHRARIASERATAAHELASVQEQLSAEALRGDAPDELRGRARRASLAARHAALSARIRALDAETAASERRAELLPARRDLAERGLSEAQALEAALRQAVATRREDDARQDSEDAARRRRRAALQHDEVEALAAENEALALERSGPAGLVEAITDTQEQLTRARAELGHLREQERGVRAKLRVAGLTGALGAVLRTQYEELPRPRDLRGDARLVRGRLAAEQLRAIGLEERRAELGDLDDELERFRAKVGALDASLLADLAQAARELLEARRALVEAMQADSRSHVDLLLELDVAIQQRMVETAAYREFIEERILWVRSTTGDWRALVPRRGALRADLAKLVGAEEWEKVVWSVRAESDEYLGKALGLALLLLLALPVRRRMRQRIRDTAELVGNYKTDRFAFTLQALVATFAVALPAPLAVWSLGWALSAIPEQQSVGVTVGQALRTTALLFYALALLRVSVAVGGLGAAHLRWPAQGVATVRRNLRWFSPTALASFFASAASHSGADETLSRLAFVAGMVAAAVFCARIFRRGSPLVTELGKRRHLGLFFRAHRARLAVTCGTFAVLAALAIAGYYYTAYTLGRRLVVSIVLILGVGLLHGLLLRWLFIARRQVAIDQARQRAQARAEGAAEASPDVEPTLLEEDRIDLPAIQVQIRRLFRTFFALALAAGLYVAWKPVLPALRVLERIEVWPRVRVVSADEALAPARPAPLEPPPTLAVAAGPSGSTDPAAAPALPQQRALGAGAPREGADEAPGAPDAVTLNEIAGALLLVVLTLAAARNLPALLEILLLQRLPLDAGARYALSNLARYLVVLVGATLAFGAIGIGWSKVQWLVAALTFGLAFGLQEIFANFISGLIILAERPIRIGDVVTVAGVDGKVSRIRMRATTIMDWDMRELLVPNKEFITGQLINWTLTDPTTRLVVPVGVAYGSDTELARELLQEVGRGVANVLAEPPPSAIFRGFGDSSLNMELRVYIPNRDVWPGVIHDLHTGIDRAFREAGIEIAFPQRDIHVRSGLEALVRPPGAAGPPPADRRAAGSDSAGV